MMGNGQMDRIFVFMNTYWPQWVVFPCPGAIYMYDDHHIQRSFLKPLSQSKPNFIGSLYRKGDQKCI